MGKRVEDIRAGYFPRASEIGGQRVYRAYTIRNRSGTFQISGPGTLGGVLVVAGAADATALVYDRDGVAGSLKDEDIIAPIKAPAGLTDGFVDFPIRASRGIVVNIDVASAIVTVYYSG